MYTAYLTRRREYFEQDIINLRNEKFRTLGASLDEAFRGKPCSIENIKSVTPMRNKWIGRGVSETWEIWRPTIIQVNFILSRNLFVCHKICQYMINRTLAVCS